MMLSALDYTKQCQYSHLWWRKEHLKVAPVNLTFVKVFFSVIELDKRPIMQLSALQENNRD